MAAVFLFIRQDLNRLSDQLGSPEKRSFCGANGILPPQPLGKPRHLSELLPVKRTMKKYKIFSASSISCWPLFMQQGKDCASQRA